VTHLAQPIQRSRPGTVNSQAKIEHRIIHYHELIDQVLPSIYDLFVDELTNIRMPILIREAYREVAQALEASLKGLAFSFVAVPPFPAIKFSYELQVS